MCQATVFTVDADQNRELVARKIANLYQDDGDVILTDLTGAETRVPGIILGADLLRAVVFIGDPALAKSEPRKEHPT
jgi:hypothetical protein